MLLVRFGFLTLACAASFSCSKNDDTTTSAVTKLDLKGSLSSGETSVRLEDGETSGSPTSLKVTFYETYVSENADCSSPTLIDDYGNDGEEMELADGDSIIQGNVPAGTYECLILVMNDNLKFKADQEAVDDHAGCGSTDTTHLFDVYREGGETDVYIDLEGNEVPATGSRTEPSEDKITIFASTGAAADITVNDKALGENQYSLLSENLTSPGEAFYYWDATDGIKNTEEDGEDYCVVEEVETGFRTAE